MVRDITQQTEYVIALTHVTRVLLGEFELMLSIGDDSVVRKFYRTICKTPLMERDALVCNAIT